jgi:hypothetical protein
MNDKLTNKHSTTAHLVGNDATKKPFDIKNTEKRKLTNVVDFIDKSKSKAKYNISVSKTADDIGKPSADTKSKYLLSVHINF